MIKNMAQRSIEEVYDALLKYQVDFSFGEEVSILKQSRWDSAKTVLDYGCGNAYYTYKLASLYPDKEYICCDRNKAILSKARTLKNMSLLCGEYPKVSVSNDIDFFIIRYLTSYLSDRVSFFRWIREHASNQASIMIVDAKDDELIVEPDMPNFMRGQDAFLQSVSDSGGCRDIMTEIRDELKEFGFACKKERHIVVNSYEPFDREKIFVYMNLVAEMDNGCVIPEDVRSELMCWISNPNSFLQYGTFVSLFELK